MSGMKVTLSAAMRARDVSRPRPEDEEAAERASTQPPPRPNSAAEARPKDPGGRPVAIPKSTSPGGRSRRKRR